MNIIFVIGLSFFIFGTFMVLKGLYGLWKDFFTEREKRREERSAEKLHSLQYYVKYRGELFSPAPRKKEENLLYGKEA